MREKIFKSLNTSDLSDEEWENAAHVVASLGAAQIGNRRQISLGAYLLHIKAGHVHFLPRVIALLALTIASRARRDGWRGVTKANAEGLAKVALDRFLDNNCADCNGVGRIGELGSVIVLCGTCKGGGKRKDDLSAMASTMGLTVRIFRDLNLIERVKYVIGLLEKMEGHASGATRTQARGANI
jgi:hypothetical protein